VKINSRERKVLTAGIVIAAAVAIFYAATSFLPNGQELVNKVKQQRTTIGRNLDILKSQETYGKQIDQYTKRLERDMTLLLDGENSSVAGAELLKLLKDFADQNGVNITSRNNLPEKKMPGMLTKVSARIETSCDLDQLVRFLAAIENHPKFLKIDELMINSFRMQAQKKYDIRPGLTITGYIRSKEEKPSEKPAGPAGAIVR
jgi:hypothetical protein